MADEKVTTKGSAQGTGEITHENPGFTGALDGFRAGPQNLAEVIAASASVATKGEAFRSRMEILTFGMDKQRNEISSRIAELKAISLTQKQELARSEIQTARRLEVTLTRDARYLALNEIKEQHDRVLTVRALYDSPAKMLAAYGIGTEERSRCTDQTANSGPTELNNLALVAANTGNKFLAVAILSRLDSMPAKSRGGINFKRDDLAARVMGDDYAKAKEAITVSINRYQSAVVSNRAYERGENNPTAKIGAALRAMKETGANEADDNE